MTPRERAMLSLHRNEEGMTYQRARGNASAPTFITENQAMMEDALQLHQPSPSSRSDLEEVGSEMTDSQANRPLMQDSTHPVRHLATP
ncbi:hypothetical protein BC629DRAFT_1592462 [Irpex lacteus]|nr:hypothetical protein BC629DRAFT_1592462 [Irpex lacteus]